MDLDAFLPTSSHLDLYFRPSKRAQIGAPIVFGGREFEQECTPSFEALSGECLFEIFRHLHSPRVRSSGARVWKRWLMLLSTRQNLQDTAYIRLQDHGDDEYYPGGSFYSNPMDLDAFLPTSSHVDLYFCPSKRALICAPVVFGGGEFEQDCTPSIQALPDECLFEIFRHPHSARERSSCAGVSKRWLMLLSTIRKAEICKSRSTCISQMVECSNVEQQNTEFDEISVVNCDEDQEDESNGFLTRCLDGKKATDVRLAAIAVGTSGRGGLGNFQFEEVTLLVELPTLVFRPLPTVALLFGCFLCGMYLLEPNLQHRFKEMVDFLVEEWEEEGLYY